MRRNQSYDKKYNLGGKATSPQRQARCAYNKQEANISLEIRRMQWICYYRLLSPLILPRELKRVLYLDPDILIINPLRALWKLDLQGKAFAAAAHTGLTEMANGINQVRLETEHVYFNSGMMLIDLEAARRLVAAEDVFGCVSAHEKDLILPDQDVFNILYGRQTVPIDDAV